MPEQTEAPPRPIAQQRSELHPMGDVGIGALRRMKGTVLARRRAAGRITEVPEEKEPDMNTLYLELLERNYSEIKMTPKEIPDPFWDKDKQDALIQANEAKDALIKSNRDKRTGFLKRVNLQPEESPFKPEELVMIGLHEHLTDAELEKMTNEVPNGVDIEDGLGLEEIHDPRFYAKYYLNQRQNTAATT